MLPIDGFLPGDFRQPVGLTRVRRRLMRVPPAGGFGHNAFVDFILPTFPPGVILARRQQATIETQRLNAIPEVPSEMGVLAQFVIQTAGRAGIRWCLDQFTAVGRGPTEIHVGKFLIPDEKFEPGAVCGALACGPPIVCRPVAGGGINVQNHVVDEVRHVDVKWIRRVARAIGIVPHDPLVIGLGGHASIGQSVHFIPRLAGS